MNKLAVEMTGIVVRFGSFTALHGVDLRVRPQTIHALVGENGTGKTTLMRVLYGAQRAAEGEVSLFGQRVSFRSQSEGIAAGVGMVSQHYSIIPELTCLQNLMLGAEPGTIIAQGPAQSKADRLAEQMGFSFPWHQPAEGIGPAQAQKLEILKLLWREAKILILDEPTAMLSPADSDLLYEKLKQLTRAGATVIVVTHRLAEVMEHADDVTVIREGRIAGHRLVAETNPAELTELIVGRPLPPSEREDPSLGPVRLALSGVRVKGKRGDEAVRGVDLEVRAGEVVGLAGVDGNGQTELIRAIAGLLPVDSGRIQLDGQDVTGLKTAARIRAGLRLIPEDRLHEAVIEDWSIEENAVLGLHHLPHLREGGKVRTDVKRSIADLSTQMFPTRFQSVRQRFGALSGGNQQKIVNARALAHEPGVILAFAPTRGIDINVTQLTYQKLREVARGGAAVLVVAFDLDELLAHCDRIVVIHSGEVAEPQPELARDRNAIGALMIGAGGHA